MSSHTSKLTKTRKTVEKLSLEARQEPLELWQCYHLKNSPQNPLNNGEEQFQHPPEE